MPITETMLYARQMAVGDIGDAGQNKLKLARVLVVGAGGLGCPLLIYLARCGVGHITIVDGDKVEASNLHRQPLYTFEDIGKAKAGQAAKALKTHNPFCSLQPVEVFLGPRNARSSVENHDLVIDCTDDLATGFLLQDACKALKLPFLSAKVHRWEGQVVTLDFRDETTACWRCLWPEPPQKGCVKSCADGGILGATVGLFGLMLGQLALMQVLGLMPLKSASTLLYDLRDMSQQKLSWPRRQDCPCCGTGKKTGSFSRETAFEDLAPDALVIDIRERQECSRLPLPMLPQTVWQRPLSQQAQWHEEVLAHKGTVACLCHSGVRSLGLIKQPAFEDARFLSVEGGLRHLPQQGVITG